MKDAALALGSFLVLAFLVGFSFTLNTSNYSSQNNNMMASVVSIDGEFTAARGTCGCGIEYENYKNATQNTGRVVSLDVQQRAMTIYAECLSLNSKSLYVHGVNKPLPIDRENMCPVPQYLESGISPDFPNKCSLLTKTAEDALEAFEKPLEEYNKACSVYGVGSRQCRAQYDEYFAKELDYAKARQSVIFNNCPLKDKLPTISDVLNKASRSNY